MLESFKKRYLEKIVAVAVPVVCAALLVTGGYFSVKGISYLYRKHKATEVLTATEKELSDLRWTITQADINLKGNAFLMQGDEETSPLIKKREESEKQMKALENMIETAKADYDAKRFDEVRAQLDETFDPEKGPVITPKIIAKRERDSLNQTVNKYCEEKRQLRDKVVNNEFLLRARLKKPYDPNMTEKTEELAKLPDEFFKLVPVRTKELEDRLKELPPELNNSLGANLVSHQWARDHIIGYGRNQQVKENGKGFYNNALGSYRQVKPKNDALKWYAAEDHDGKFSILDYRELMNKQAEAISFINNGDNQLSALDAYLNELHQQEYVFVAKHEKKEKSFTHTRTVPSIDFEGNLKLETETYHTTGNEFFYVLRTETPNGAKDEKIRVGEIDSETANWNYAQNESVGFIRKWKKLHEDNSTIFNGFEIEKQPYKIEQMPEACRKK